MQGLVRVPARALGVSFLRGRRLQWEARREWD